jgi:hypothetical protein
VADQHYISHAFGLAGRWRPASGSCCCFVRHTTASLRSRWLLLVPAFTHGRASTSPRTQSVAVNVPRAWFGAVVKQID